MTKKNTFRFAAFTAAALGLGLLVSGCGDGGSTEPNPLNGNIGRVIYNYNVLAQATANARADVDAQIASVQYSLEGELSRTYNFEHKDTDTEVNVEIQNVDCDVQTVTAAYFDAKGSLIAVGVDKLNWVDKVATVSDPQIIMLGEDPTFDFSASDYVVAPNGETELSVKAVPTGYDGSAIDITDFAVFYGINKEVLAPVVDGIYGEYYGVSYGTIDAAEAYAMIPGRADHISLNQNIYVTDQTPSSITLIPADPEFSVESVRTELRVGKLSDVEASNQAYILYAPNDKVSFGLDKVAVHSFSDTSSASGVMPFNKMALKVLALEYTNEEGKGPQPVVSGDGVDITDDPNVAITIDPTSEDQENNASITADKFVEISGVSNSYDRDEYKAVATYGGSEEVADALLVLALQPNSELIFANEDGFLSQIAETGTYNMFVAGRISCLDMESDPLAVPASVIAEGAYPAVKELTDAEAYIEEYVQNKAGENAYTVKVTSVPAAGDAVSLDLSETTDPAFTPTDVVE
ncbi:MAG: hypothetical protein ACI38Q_06015 [Candidatus Bruticola sp.]